MTEATDWKKQRESVIEQLKKMDIQFKEVTCDTCPSAKDGTCEYAWDAYNTDGDCLAIK